MLHYILQIIAFQLFFLMVYDVFLKNETFFNWNRVYLLSTTVLSLTLPFIKIESFKRVVPRDYVIALPEIFLGQTKPTMTKTMQETVTGTGWGFNWWWLYGLGACVACFIFVYKVFKIYKVLWRNNTQEINGYKVVVVHNSNMAFSCFGYVVLGSDLSTEEQQTILQHEAIHIDQKHSWDLLLFELLRIVFWFNPLVYMYQSRISILHEYIADAAAIKNQGKQAYYKGLLNQVFNTQNISFINTFFNQSLIKKRIVMLQKSRSKQTQLIKYALLIPLVFGMLIYTSCSNETRNTETAQEKEISVSEAISEIKNSIQKTGSLSEEEEMSLLLLSDIIKSEELDPSLISKAQEYINKGGKSNVEEQVADILFVIQSQGGLEETELKELKSLLVFIQPKGFEDNYYGDVVSEVEVPYTVVEKAPVFPGCETSLDNDVQKSCFNTKMMEHVVANFNQDLAKEVNLTGVQKISVFFKIDANGKITDAKARASHPKLEEEALRVVALLPKMTPGTQKGKQVTVPYYLPIKFEAQ